MFYREMIKSRKEGAILKESEKKIVPAAMMMYNDKIIAVRRK